MTFRADLQKSQTTRQLDSPRLPNLRSRFLTGYAIVSGIVLAGAIFIAGILDKQLEPIATNTILIRNIPLILIAMTIIAMLTGFLFWVVALRLFIQPIERLVDFSEAIRWRGHLRESESAELAQLALQSAQIGSLAQSLMAMEQEITARFTQLNTLLETSRVIAGSLEVNRVIDNILAQIQSLFHVEKCAVLSFDERAQVFHMVANRGLGTDYAKRYNVRLTHPDLPSMRALQNRSPVQVADTETDLSFIELRDRSRSEGFRSVLAVPLVPEHAPPAVLLLYKNEPYRYSYTELELATSFANHASVALENAGLYALTDEKLQEQTQRLEAIVESMRDGLILESLTGKVLYCNQQAANLIGLHSGEIVGKNSAGITQTLFHAKQPLKTRTFDLDHGEQALRIHLFDVTDARGKLLGRGQLWQDITLDKQLDRMKTALVSTVSHELRTPLATIKGYASTLLASDVKWTVAEQNEFLQTISKETDRLTALVKNLLDMSRIEAGILDLRCEPHLLNELLSQVIHSFVQPVQERLQITTASNLPLVPLDASRISTVIRNLIENAVKYSPDETPIEIYTYQKNGHVGLRVRDYGRGVSPEHAERIFDRFYREDNRLTRKVGGVGLGLAICKGFIEAHKGQIWLRSESSGTTFGFSLPVSQHNILTTNMQMAKN